MAVAVSGFGFTFTVTLIGSLTCDDRKGNNGKVTLIYTCVLPFLCISLLLLRDYAFSRFMKKVNKRRRRFLSLSKL